jgi:hypothetical protein
MMIRREAFDAVDGFDEQFFLYWEDADFCFRLKRAGWSVVYNPGERVTHLTGRSSARAQRRSLLVFHRSAYRYYRKNSGRLLQAAAPLVFVALYARLAVKLASIEVQRLSKGSSIHGSIRFRSCLFRDVVGHRRILSLDRIHQRGSLPPSPIFSGPKAWESPVAQAVAQALNCTAPVKNAEDACGKMPACRRCARDLFRCSRSSW